MMQRLIPKVFYEKIADGLLLFVTCLGFAILHQDENLVVAERDGAKVYLVQDAEFATRDRPEITIETDDADALYAEISSQSPELLHPNARTIESKSWGSREFAVLDRTGVCVIFRQWQGHSPESSL